MSFLTFLFFGFLVFIIFVFSLFLFCASLDKEDAQKMKNRIIYTQGFKESIIYSNNNFAIGISDKRKEVIIARKGREIKIISFSDILFSEISINNKTIINSKVSPNLGAAVLGGVVAGPIGALIGGGFKSSSSVQKNEIENVSLRVYISDFSESFFEIKFPNNQNGIKEVNEWYGKMLVAQNT